MSATLVRASAQSGIDLRGVRGSGLALYAGAVGVVAVAYYIAGRIGLELAYLDGAVAALWPPAGLGLAALFLFGGRLWPGVVVRDLLLGGFSTPLATLVAPTARDTGAPRLAAPAPRRPAG